VKIRGRGEGSNPWSIVIICGRAKRPNFTKKEEIGTSERQRGSRGGLGKIFTDSKKPRTSSVAKHKRKVKDRKIWGKRTGQRPNHLVKMLPEGGKTGRPGQNKNKGRPSYFDHENDAKFGIREQGGGCEETRFKREGEKFRKELGGGVFLPNFCVQGEKRERKSTEKKGKKHMYRNPSEPQNLGHIGEGPDLWAVMCLKQ